eukprot:COSAG01_NODE_6905_length_3444_cov_19.912108_5_plen_102_part_00
MAVCVACVVRAWLLCHQVIRAADGGGAAAAEGEGAEEDGYLEPGPGAVGDLLVNPSPPGCQPRAGCRHANGCVGLGSTGVGGDKPPNYSNVGESQSVLMMM